MTVPARVSLVTIGVADVPGATAFYEALGWQRSSASVEGVVSFFQVGGAVVSLFGRDDLIADATRTVGDPPGPINLAINLESAEAVDAAAAEWVAAGGTVVKPPQDVVFGYAGYVADPDGHLWELAWNPSFPLQPDGTITLP
jgi:predicted lactoylglutathione lyase